MNTSTGEASPGLPGQLAGGALAGAWVLDPARSTVALHSKSMWGLRPIRGSLPRGRGGRNCHSRRPGDRSPGGEDRVA